MDVCEHLCGGEDRELENLWFTVYEHELSGPSKRGWQLNTKQIPRRLRGWCKRVGRGGKHLQTCSNVKTSTRDARDDARWRLQSPCEAQPAS